MDETLWASRWVHWRLPYAYHSAAKKWRDCPQHEQVPDDMRAVNAIVEQEHARAERISQAAGDEQDQERAWYASDQGRGRRQTRDGKTRLRSMLPSSARRFRPLSSNVDMASSCQGLDTSRPICVAGLPSL